MNETLAILAVVKQLEFLSKELKQEFLANLCEDVADVLNRTVDPEKSEVTQELVDSVLFHADFARDEPKKQNPTYRVGVTGVSTVQSRLNTAKVHHQRIVRDYQNAPDSIRDEIAEALDASREAVDELEAELVREQEYAKQNENYG